MKYAIWRIKRNIRTVVTRSVGFFRYITTPLTVQYLKSELYENLPIPIAWERLTKGRELQVEIGSGHGEVLVNNDKSKAIRVGYEIRTRFYKLAQSKIRNRQDAFIFKGNAYESLFLHYRNNSVDKVYALFPDPWHKPKHAKRRPLNEQFFRKIAQKMKKGGMVLVATDWPDYQEFVSAEAKKVQDLYEVSSKEYNQASYGLPVTHYHQKWVRKGRKFIAIELIKR